MDFSSNDYVLGNYDDKISLDCEECLVIEHIGDIPLAISNNSLTKNSLQEKLYEQQGHTTLMLLMKFDVVEGSSEKITDVQSSHFQKDRRGVILDYISIAKKEDLSKQLCPLDQEKFVLSFENPVAIYLETYFSKVLKFSDFIKSSACLANMIFHKVLSGNCWFLFVTY